jgi:hypothetical protein
VFSSPDARAVVRAAQPFVYLLIGAPIGRLISAAHRIGALGVNSNQEGL